MPKASLPFTHRSKEFIPFIQLPPMHRLWHFANIKFLVLVVLVLLVGAVHGDQRVDYNADSSSVSYDLKTDENQSTNQSYSNDSRVPYSENWSASNQPDESEQFNESELLDQLDLTDQLEQLNQFDKLDIDLDSGLVQSSRQVYPLYQADHKDHTNQTSQIDPASRTDQTSQKGQANGKQADEVDKTSPTKANLEDRPKTKRDPARAEQPATTERRPTGKPLTSQHQTVYHQASYHQGTDQMDEQQAEQPLLDEPKQTRSVQKIPIGKHNFVFPF